MNEDVEKILNGSDAEFAAFVTALRTAPQAKVSATFTSEVMAKVRLSRKTAAYGRGFFQPSLLFPLAACLVALLAIGAIFFRPIPTFSLANLVACQRADGYFTGSAAAPYVQAFAVTVLAKDPTADRRTLDQAVDALVRTQDAAGGWSSRALSARNVAALSVAAKAGVKRAQNAYRKGMRYLRVHGIAEMSAAQLAQAAKDSLARLDAATDPGAVCCLSLCAAD